MLLREADWVYSMLSPNGLWPVVCVIVVYVAIDWVSRKASQSMRVEESF